MIILRFHFCLATLLALFAVLVFSATIPPLNQKIDTEKNQDDRVAIEIAHLAPPAGSMHLCPICRDEVDSPSDAATLCFDGKHACKHIYCKECANAIVYCNIIDGEYNKRCSVCKTECDEVLIVNISDQEKLFRLFDPNSSQKITADAYENALAIFQMDKFPFAMVEKALSAFRDLQDDSQTVSKENFQFLWASLTRIFAEWLAKPPRKSNEYVVSTKSPPNLLEMAGMSHSDARRLFHLSAVRSSVLRTAMAVAENYDRRNRRSAIFNRIRSILQQYDTSVSDNRNYSVGFPLLGLVGFVTTAAVAGAPLIIFPTVGGPILLVCTVNMVICIRANIS